MCVYNTIMGTLFHNMRVLCPALRSGMDALSDNNVRLSVCLSLSLSVCRHSHNQLPAATRRATPAARTKHLPAKPTRAMRAADTLESRRAVLSERFFRRSVLREASCLHYLLPDKRDSSVTDRLRHAKRFHSIQARTNKFRNSFLPFCLQHFD